MISLSVSSPKFQQATNDDLSAIRALRKQLNAQYDAYVAKHGPINLHEIQEPRQRTAKQVDREYWAQKKGQAALDKQNAPMIADSITPRQIAHPL